MVATTRVKPSLGCGYVLAGVLLLAGIGLLWLAVSEYQLVGKRIALQVVVLATLGFVVLIGAGVYLQIARKIVRDFIAEDRRRAKFPTQPWKWRKEWLTPGIASKDASGVGLAWLLAVMVNAISLPAAYAVLTKSDLPRPVYLVLIFPVIGVALLGSALYRTLRWRKFGRTRFMPSPLPGSIGGYLAGVIEVPARVTLEKDARLTLRCIHRFMTGAGKNRRIAETVQWEREERIPAEKWSSGPGHTEIPVLFYIPTGQPPTDLDDRDNQMVWRLSAKAEVPGVDFETTFEVPVFVTGETAPPPTETTPLLDAYRPQSLDADELARAGVERHVDRWCFHSKHLRLPRTVFTAIAAGLTGLLWSFIGDDVHGVVWAGTALFALFAWVMAADLWASQCGLRIQGSDLVVREARLLGPRERRVPRAAVMDIRAEKSIGIGAQQYYRLVLVGRGVDELSDATANEPFRTRKIRHQLKQLGHQAKDGQTQPREKLTELLAQLAKAPQFEITFAKHLPGPKVMESVKAMVLADIRK